MKEKTKEVPENQKARRYDKCDISREGRLLIKK